MHHGVPSLEGRRWQDKVGKEFEAARKRFNDRVKSFFSFLHELLGDVCNRHMNTLLGHPEDFPCLTEHPEDFPCLTDIGESYIAIALDFPTPRRQKEGRTEWASTIKLMYDCIFDLKQRLRLEIEYEKRSIQLPDWDPDDRTCHYSEKLLTGSVGRLPEVAAIEEIDGEIERFVMALSLRTDPDRGRG